MKFNLEKSKEKEGVFCIGEFIVNFFLYYELFLCNKVFHKINKNAEADE